MANVYIEAHPKGGGSVQHYVVEDHADHISPLRPINMLPLPRKNAG
jgi:hypothetical protein